MIQNIFGIPRSADDRIVKSVDGMDMIIMNDRGTMKIFVSKFVGNKC